MSDSFHKYIAEYWNKTKRQVNNNLYLYHFQIKIIS